jgi:hypothetical protein
MGGPICIGMAAAFLRIVVSVVKPQKAINLIFLKEVFLSQIILIVVFFTTSIYPLLISTASSPLKCQSIGNKIVMTDNPSAECYSAEWFGHLGWALFFLATYGLVCPGFLIWMFWTNKKDVGSPIFMEKFFHISAAYIDKYYWFEFVYVLRRASFVMMSAFLARAGASINLFCSILLQLGFLALESSIQPFKNPLNMKKSIW